MAIHGRSFPSQIISSHGPASPPVPETITVDKWFANTEHTVWTKTPLVREGFVCTDARSLLNAERTTPDKYAPRQSEPRWQIKPLVPEGDYKFDRQAEFRINMDKWYKETERPPKTYRPLVREGISVIDARQLTQVERTTMDKWFRQLERSLLIKPAAIKEGLFIINKADENITVDKYIQISVIPIEEIGIVGY